MDIDIEALFRLSGVAGVAAYISSYFLLQAGLLRGSGYPYAILNLIAASLVLISLVTAFNLASAMIQVAWIAISLVGIARIFWSRHRVRFTDEEQVMVRAVLEDWPPPLARKLLSRGIWADGTPGQELTREGAPVTHVCFMSEGAADVQSGGVPVAELTGGLVGEMNVMAGGPASATVILRAPSRIFTLPGATLREMSAKDSEVRYFLEKAFRTATKHKLVDANRRLTDQSSRG